MQYKLISFFVLILMFSAAQAQHQTSSPYSRYGLGEIRHTGFAQNFAMGGTGIALRTPMVVNPLNPASYSATTPKTFTLEAGLRVKYDKLATQSQSQVNNDMNIDYFTMAFPITKWMGFAAGLMPFSSVGYDIIQEQENFTIEYKGQGGVNKAFFGTGATILDHISLGVNGAYYFGDVQNKVITDFNSDYSTSILHQSESRNYGGLTYEAGMQGEISLAGFDFVLGATYSNSQTITANHYAEVYQAISINGKNFVDSVNTQLQEELEVTLPGHLGAGLSISRNGLTVSADYTRRLWSEAKIMDGTGDNLIDEDQISVGLKYVPDVYSTNYFKIVHYHIGGYLGNSHLQINTETSGFHQLQRYGLTMGALLPLRKTNTLINIGIEAGRFGTTKHDLIQETYLQLTLGLLFKDIWFQKRVFD